jgi:hypothetical protein
MVVLYRAKHAGWPGSMLISASIPFGLPRAVESEMEVRLCSLARFSQRDGLGHPLSRKFLHEKSCARAEKYNVNGLGES